MEQKTCLHPYIGPGDEGWKRLTAWLNFGTLSDLTKIQTLQIILCFQSLSTTHYDASEPQRRVRDFCFSLSDTSELRRALNFPSRASHLQEDPKPRKLPARCRHAYSFESFLGILPLNSRFFFHHLVLHVCPSI